MWRLVVRHPAHLPVAYELKFLFDHRTVPTVELPSRGKIDIQVVDAFDEPVSGLRLFAHSRPITSPGKNWRPDTRQVVTAADGRVILPGHAEETVTIAALAQDGFLHHKLEPGTQAVTLRLETPLAATRLLAADGRPAPSIIGAIRRPFLAFAISGPGGEILTPFRQGQVRQGQVRQGQVPLYFADHRGAYGPARLEEASSEETTHRILHLPATVQLKGQVLDTKDQKPIPGTWVWSQGFFWQSDHRGAFNARLRKRQHMDFVVVAPGYRSEKVRLPSPEPVEQRIDIHLNASMTLAGRVVDADGRRLHGAQVEAIANSEKLFMVGAQGEIEMFLDPEAMQPDPMSGQTDHRGHFRLTGLAPEFNYGLRVHLAGYAARTVFVNAVERGEIPEMLEITLEPGVVAVGLVVDGDGRPIAGADVALRADSTMLSSSHGDLATTDTAGRFVLSDLSRGMFSLLVEAPDFEPMVVSRIEIRPQQGELDLGEITLNSTVMLRGQVTDPQGNGLAGAHIGIRQYANHSARSREQVTAVSDHDGAFEVEGMPPTSPLRVRVSHQGFQEALLSEVRADSGTPLHIVLRPGIALRGQVVDSLGFPALQASVELHRQVDGEFLGIVTEAEKDGRFDLPAQAPGEVILNAHSEQGRGEPLKLQLVPGQSALDVTLVLKPGTALEGRVVAPEGKAVVGAYLSVERRAGGGDNLESLSPSADTSDGDGRFRLGGLTPGRHLISVDHPEFDSLNEWVELGDGTSQEIELAFRQRRQNRPISGQVVDPAGEGLQGVSVRLLTPQAGSGPAGQASSYSDGRFELTAPRDGDYAIIAQHTGFATQRTAFFYVDEEGVESVVVRLEPGGSVTGEVLGLEPQEHRRLTVVAYEPTHGGRIGQVGDGGQYRVSNLPPGTWRVTAKTSSARATSDHITLGPGEEQILDLRFENSHRLTGIALRDGERLAGADLVVLCLDTPFYHRTNSDDSGRFIVESVPTARCTLTLSDPRSGSTRKDDLTVDGDTEVAIEISSGAAG